MKLLNCKCGKKPRLSREKAESIDRPGDYIYRYSLICCYKGYSTLCIERKTKKFGFETHKKPMLLAVIQGWNERQAQ